MFDRFTDRARKTMGLARQASQRFNHAYIGPEHILIGLLDRDLGGFAQDVLANLDVHRRHLREAVEQRMTPGEALVTMGQIPFTPAARRVLERAFEEWSNLGHDNIGTEHLLLGLLRDDEMAGKVLTEARVLHADVREEVATRRRRVIVLTSDDEVVARIVRPALGVAGLAHVHVQDPEAPGCVGEILDSLCERAGLAIAVAPVTPGIAYAAGLCRGYGAFTVVYAERPPALPPALGTLPVVANRDELEAFLRDTM